MFTIKKQFLKLYRFLMNVFTHAIFWDVSFIFSHFKHQILPYWSTEHGNVNK